MAHLRVSLAFVVAALAPACDQAGAQAGAATSGIAPPAGWHALPDVARAAADAAKSDGIAVASEAWGETARGCYAVWLSLAGSGASVEQVLEGIASERLETKDIVKPGADSGGKGLVTLAFSRPGYAGRLRARVEAGGITALACFANEREPIACEAACTALLGSLP